MSSPAALSRSISWNYLQAGTSLIVVFPADPDHRRPPGRRRIWNLGVAEYSALLPPLPGLRLHNALVKYVAEYAERRDWKTVNGLVGTSTSLLSLAGVTALILSGALAWLVVPAAFHVPVERMAELQLATVLLGVDLLIAFPASVLGAALEGRQRFDVLSGVSMGTTISCGILTVAGLQLGYGILTLVAIEIARTLLTAVGLGFGLRRVSPEIRVALGSPWGPPPANASRLQHLDIAQ